MAKPRGGSRVTGSVGPTVRSILRIHRTSRDEVWISSSDPLFWSIECTRVNDHTHPHQRWNLELVDGHLDCRYGQNPCDFNCGSWFDREGRNTTRVWPVPSTHIFVHGARKTRGSRFRIVLVSGSTGFGSQVCTPTPVPPLSRTSV